MADELCCCVLLCDSCCSRGAELRPSADQSALTCDPINEAFIHLAGRGACTPAGSLPPKVRETTFAATCRRPPCGARGGRTRTLFGRCADTLAAGLPIKTQPGSGFICPTLPPTCHFSLPTKLCSLANPAPNAQRGLDC